MTATAPVFMALEPLLIERINDRLRHIPALKILSGADLAGIDERAQPVPAVHVIFGGHQERVQDHLVERVERWLTVVAVRNARSQVSGQDARADAGPILTDLHAALLGWQPKGVKPVQPAAAPRPGFSAGFGYFPLAWEARFAKYPMPCPAII